MSISINTPPLHALHGGENKLSLPGAAKGLADNTLMNSF
ncbi:hypothetical protein ALT721_1050030 [Alteromonas alvinellae]